MLRTILSLLLLFLIASCGSREEIVARYDLEKLVWHARLIEQRASIDQLRGSERDLDRVIAAYKRVIEDDPLSKPHAGSWEPAVTKDIRRILLGSRITLARLTFLGERYLQPGIYFEDPFADPALQIAGAAGRRQRIARSLYGIDGAALPEMECETYFRQIVGSDEFWTTPLAIGDTFLDIPVFLARAYKANGDTHSFDDVAELAETFYARVIRVWPDSMIAEKARLHHIRLLTVREEWRDAARQIDEMLAHSYGRGIASRLLFMKARIVDAGMEQPGAATRIYTTLVNDYPGSPESRMGGVCLAMIRARSGDTEIARTMLRTIEKDDAASDAQKGLAMLARAIQLRNEGSWNESLVILRRLQNLYPYTPAALEAPILITAHFMESGDSVLAIRSLERSNEYYLPLLRRGNALFNQGYVPEDYLIENYLVAGRVREVVQLLLEESRRWGWSGNAAALLKSAHLCANAAGDEERAQEILKKSLALFSQTRYATVAGNSLAALERN